MPAAGLGRHRGGDAHLRFPELREQQGCIDAP